MKFNREILLSILLTANTLLFSQSFTVDAKIDSVHMLIGQQCNLIFEVSTTDKDTKISFPLFADTIVSGLEIVDFKSDTIQNADKVTIIKRVYTVTSFDSALYYIPPFIFVSGDDTVESNNLAIKILSVPIDTTQKEIPITDIKPIVDAPFDWQLLKKIILIVVASLIVVLIGMWFLIRYLKDRKTCSVDTGEKIIQKTDYQIAIEKLEQIKKEKIWQQNRVKEYYTQITDVIREWIEKRFDIIAFERTSSEIIDSLEFSRKNYDCELNLLQQMFYTSDMVKFAKLIPDINMHNRLIDEAIAFVEATNNSADSSEQKSEQKH